MVLMRREVVDLFLDPVVVTVFKIEYCFRCCIFWSTLAHTHRYTQVMAEAPTGRVVVFTLSYILFLSVMSLCSI
jgi:hypothetical protein